MTKLMQLAKDENLIEAVIDNNNVNHSFLFGLIQKNLNYH